MGCKQTRARANLTTKPARPSSSATVTTLSPTASEGKHGLKPHEKGAILFPSPPPPPSDKGTLCSCGERPNLGADNGVCSCPCGEIDLQQSTDSSGEADERQTSACVSCAADAVTSTTTTAAPTTSGGEMITVSTNGTTNSTNSCTPLNTPTLRREDEEEGEEDALSCTARFTISVLGRRSTHAPLSSRALDEEEEEAAGAQGAATNAAVKFEDNREGSSSSNFESRSTRSSSTMAYRHSSQPLRREASDVHYDCTAVESPPLLLPVSLGHARTFPLSTSSPGENSNKNTTIIIAASTRSTPRRATTTTITPLPAPAPADSKEVKEQATDAHLVRSPELVLHTLRSVCTTQPPTPLQLSSSCARGRAQVADHNDISGTGTGGREDGNASQAAETAVAAKCVMEVSATDLGVKGKRMKRSAERQPSKAIGRADSCNTTARYGGDCSGNFYHDATHDHRSARMGSGASQSTIPGDSARRSGWLRGSSEVYAAGAACASALERASSGSNLSCSASKASPRCKSKAVLTRETAAVTTGRDPSGASFSFSPHIVHAESHQGLSSLCSPVTVEEKVRGNGEVALTEDDDDAPVGPQQPILTEGDAVLLRYHSYLTSASSGLQPTAPLWLQPLPSALSCSAGGKKIDEHALWRCGGVLPQQYDTHATSGSTMEQSGSFVILSNKEICTQIRNTSAGNLKSILRTSFATSSPSQSLHTQTISLGESQYLIVRPPAPFTSAGAATVTGTSSHHNTKHNHNRTDSSPESGARHGYRPQAPCFVAWEPAPGVSTGSGNSGAMLVDPFPGGGGGGGGGQCSRYTSSVAASCVATPTLAPRVSSWLVPVSEATTPHTGSTTPRRPRVSFAMSGEAADPLLSSPVPPKAARQQQRAAAFSSMTPPSPVLSSPPPPLGLQGPARSPLFLCLGGGAGSGSRSGSHTPARNQSTRKVPERNRRSMRPKIPKSGSCSPILGSPAAYSQVASYYH